MTTTLTAPSGTAVTDVATLALNSEMPSEFSVFDAETIIEVQVAEQVAMITELTGDSLRACFTLPYFVEF